MKNQHHALACFLSVAACISGAAQTWTQLNPIGPTPPGNIGGSVVYDAASNSLILFGGASPTPTPTNATWVLSNANGLAGTPAWTALTPNAPLPPARMHQSAVYDAANNRLIVFGGAVPYSAIYNDVWVLTNANGTGGAPQWTQLFPSGPAPSPRIGHSAVYDAAANRMTVFGGCYVFPYCVETNDTWVLTNANGLGGAPQWIQLSPSGALPAARLSQTAGYDPATNRMTIFGGNGTSKYNDVWTLQNANGLGGAAQWTQLFPSGNTPQRYDAPGVYNPATNQLTVALGVTGGDCPGCGQLTTDAWSLSFANGNGSPAWQQLAVSGGPPPARNSVPSSAALDAANNRMIIFGGLDKTSAALNDVWILALNPNTDTTPPVITSSISPAPLNGWNKGPATVTWSVSDPESGIASSTGCNTTLLTSETAGTTLTCSATNGAGLSNSATATVRIDLTPPSVSITSPAPNASIVIGTTATVTYACSDTLSGVVSCVGPVASGSAMTFAGPGPQSFTVNASDVAGNTASATANFKVVYLFTGFLPPIQNLPATNSVRAGQTVPVKWQLQNAAGAYIPDLATFAAITASPIGCDSAPTNIVADTAIATGGTALRYDATSNQFVYNWQTSSTASGCWALQLTLIDGTTHLAKFAFR